MINSIKIALVLPFFATLVARWVYLNFGIVDLEQVIFHIVLPMGNVITGGRRILLYGLVECLIPGVMIALIVNYCLKRFDRARLCGRWWIPVSALVLSVVGSVAIVSQVVNLADPLGSSVSIPKEGYVDPVVNAAQDPKNLILIYVESLEQVYVGNKFSADRLLSGVDLFRKERSYSVSRFVQAEGASWTIAGITASQCGVPLLSLKNIGVGVDRFLSGYYSELRCLGDVLSDAGYYNVFLGGADREFSGKVGFLRQHGYHEIWGVKEFLGKYDDLQLNEWGVDDQVLFADAKTRFAELSASGRPFNITMLTLGTHHPGFVSPSCPKNFGDYRDAIKCSDLLIADFLEFVDRHGGFKNTVVVVMGDHLSMANPLLAGVGAKKSRSIYNKIIAPEWFRVERSEITHFDIFPTLIVALGFHLNDGRAGFGRSFLVGKRCQCDKVPLMMDECACH